MCVLDVPNTKKPEARGRQSSRDLIFRVGFGIGGGTMPGFILLAEFGVDLEPHCGQPSQRLWECGHRQGGDVAFAVVRRMVFAQLSVCGVHVYPYLW